MLSCEAFDKNFIQQLRAIIIMNWRPGRDSDPGPAGDSRIY
jgi:hypothetical protein